MENNLTLSDVKDQNTKLKILIYKFKIELEKYRKLYDEARERNDKQEFDLLNVFDISNELAQERNPENIEKILFYFILGHFNFKPLLLIEHNKEKSDNLFDIKLFFGISQKHIPGKSFAVTSDELALINDKTDTFELSTGLYLGLIDNPIFFEALEKLNIMFIIPLVNKNNYKLLLAFGSRGGGNKSELSSKDKMILKVLKNSAIISLDNANMIAELDNKNIELNKNLGLVSSLYDEIQQSYEELKKMDKIKSDFLNLISHEMLTPLTSIKAYSETLMSEDIEIEPEEQKQFLDIIYGESNKIEYIITNLLLMMNLESGSYKFSFETGFFEPVVNEAIKEATEKNKEKKPDIIIDNKIDSLKVDIDYQMMKIALKNIIDNAIKYSVSTEPVVKIFAEKVENNEVIIKIQDDGPGISENNIENIFDKFHLTGDINYHQEGMGIGLPMAKIIIEKGHKGRISLANNSDLKSGLMVMISIPINHTERESSQEILTMDDFQ